MLEKATKTNDFNVFENELLACFFPILPTRGPKGPLKDLLRRAYGALWGSLDLPQKSGTGPWELPEPPEASTSLALRFPQEQTNDFFRFVKLSFFYIFNEMDLTS